MYDSGRLKLTVIAVQFGLLSREARVGQNLPFWPKKYSTPLLSVHVGKRIENDQSKIFLTKKDSC